MLNPAEITDAITTFLQGIPEVAAEMANDPNNIRAFHYMPGGEFRLAEAVSKLASPAMLVAWEATLPRSKPDGQTLWVHQFAIYIRAANQAGSGTPKSYEYLWWAIVSRPGASGHRLIESQMVNGLDIPDVPGIKHQVDEDLIDFFVMSLSIPELGDN